MTTTAAGPVHARRARQRHAEHAEPRQQPGQAQVHRHLQEQIVRVRDVRLRPQ